jgi:hypothetical protein
MQIQVEIRPVEVVGYWPFDPRQLRDRGIGEPGELSEREKKLSFIEH